MSSPRSAFPVNAATREAGIGQNVEKHLAQMDGRYRGLLEAAPDAMVVVNQSGEIVLLNLQAEKQFGYRRDELLGQKVTNIIPDGFAERLIADGLRSAAEALAQQIGTGIELTARRKDGSEFPIEIMLSPLESADGILVTAAIRDISVRKAAETAPGADGGPLSRAARSGARCDGGGQPGRRDRPPQRPGGEAVRLPPRRAARAEGHATSSPRASPNGWSPTACARPKTRWPSRSAPASSSSARRKDGSEFPIEIMLSPLESAEGILVTAAIRNISVRKAAEKHLAQMEGRYRGLLEAAPDAMVVVNQGGEIVLLNLQAEKQFGYRRDELLGQQVTNIIPEGFAERLIADGSALRGGRAGAADRHGHRASRPAQETAASSRSRSC